MLNECNHTKRKRVVSLTKIRNPKTSLAKQVISYQAITFTSGKTLRVTSVTMN
jgi:nucleoid DNA-binding protein